MRFGNAKLAWCLMLFGLLARCNCAAVSVQASMSSRLATTFAAALTLQQDHDFVRPVATPGAAEELLVTSVPASAASCAAADMSRRYLVRVAPDLVDQSAASIAAADMSRRYLVRVAPDLVDQDFGTFDGHASAAASSFACTFQNKCKTAREGTQEPQSREFGTAASPKTAREGTQEPKSRELRTAASPKDCKGSNTKDSIESHLIISSPSTSTSPIVGLNSGETASQAILASQDCIPMLPPSPIGGLNSGETASQAILASQDCIPEPPRTYLRRRSLFEAPSDYVWHWIECILPILPTQVASKYTKWLQIALKSSEISVSGSPDFSTSFIGTSGTAKSTSFGSNLCQSCANFGPSGVIQISWPYLRRKSEGTVLTPTTSSRRHWWSHAVRVGEALRPGPIPDNAVILGRWCTGSSSTASILEPPCLPRGPSCLDSEDDPFAALGEHASQDVGANELNETRPSLNVNGSASIVRDQLEAGVCDNVRSTLEPVRAAQPFDAAFSDEQLATWRRAELLLRVGYANEARTRKRKASNDDKVLPQDLNSLGASVPAPEFEGARVGYIFGMRGDVLGYHRDAASCVGVSSSVGQTNLRSTILLAELLNWDPDPPPARRRARRRRQPDGARIRPRRARLLDDSKRCAVPEQTDLCNTALRDAGIWTIDTANTNCWNAAVSPVLANTSADVVLLQEHKIRTDERMAAASRTAQTLGWRSHLALAHTTALDSASGGVGIFCRRRTGLHAHTGIVKEGYQHRLQASWLGAVMRGGIHLCSIWLVHSQGLSETNLAILAEAAALLGAIAGPWVIGGDWNISPQLLESCGWLDVIHGKIVATPLPTCNGSTYDFFVVSRSIAHAVVGVSRIDDAGFKPHFPSRLYIAGDARRKAVRRLVRPRRIHGSLPHGPLPQSGNDDWQLPAIRTPADLAYGIDKWYSSARKAVHSLIGEPCQYFRPRFRWEPAAGQPAKQYAGASRVSVAWREVSTRACEVAAIMSRSDVDAGSVRVLARHAHKINVADKPIANAPGEETPAMRRWITAFQVAAVAGRTYTIRSLASLAANRAAKIEARVRTARLAGYRKALTATSIPLAVASGVPSRLAFRYVRGISGWARSPIGPETNDDSTPDADGFDDYASEALVELAASSLESATLAPLSEQGALDKEAVGWATNWAVDAPYQQPYFPPHLLGETQPMTLWAFDRAVSSFPTGTGVGADNFAPRAVLRLPEEARRMLICIMLAAEALGTWSEALNLVLIVLLSKSDGGLRPIGLFPTPARLWMRVRATVARAWEVANHIPSVFGGACKGAQRAAWAAAFAAEESAAQGQQHLASLLDLVKAFERIPHHLVVVAAVRLGFDLIVLRLSLAAYRLARSIGVEGTFSALLIATRGITAGSGFATIELRILLHEAIVIGTRRWPLLQLCLYVDDLTVAASGSSRVALDTVSQATDFFVRVFEEGFRLEVSCTKSFAIAAKPSLAAVLARSTRRKILQAVRAGKMLGAPFAGGRRRSVKTLKVRLKAFSDRTPRIHALRMQKIDTTQIVRAMGAPVMLYGIDIMGASNTHLQTVRVAALRAALPPGASRNVDIGFSIFDSGGGKLDPSYSAHSTPVKHWGLALWQSWAPIAELIAVFNSVHDKLSVIHARGQSVWSAVAGPVGALIATLWRIGWECVSATTFRDDTGETVDLLCLSPAIVVAAVHKSVERWRLQRVIAAEPAIVGSGLDTMRTPDNLCPGVPFSILVTRPVAWLLQGKGRPPDAVPQWCGACRSQLLSVTTGGQWPQARVAKIPGATDDIRCQLCFSDVGTLLHRRCCPATMPADGWPPPPGAGKLLLDRIGERRTDLLRTRGLLAISVPRPPRQQETTIHWFTDAPDVTRDDLVWYTDGSMKFEAIWELRRTGCAIVVVSAAGDLVAFGNAVPAPWVRTAAAAELWAVMLVLTCCIQPPCIVTDCQSILTAAAAGSASAAAPDRVLGHLWGRIAVLLDADVSLLVTPDHLIWMPAHGAATSISQALRSDGNHVTALDWRANRLADALAKAAIGPTPECVAAMMVLDVAETLVKHECAVLGAVTHAANHHIVSITDDGGAQRCKIVRDSSGIKRGATKPPRAVRQTSASAPLTAPRHPRCLVDPVPRHARQVERSTARRAATLARKADANMSVAAILDGRVARQRPASEPPAQGRFEAIRSRILAKAVDAPM